MDDARDVPDKDETFGAEAEEGSQSNSDAIDLPTSTTLIEVSPGVAVVFGEIPPGLELISLDMIPFIDRSQLSTALGSLGNSVTIAGNLGEAAVGAQGLFRVNDATLTLLKSGGEMAAKDGAKLGAILRNGEIVAQARFIPVALTPAAALAAIGPAVAMIAVQMQISEVSSLVQSNIQLTAKTLKTMRNKQWAELEGLVKSVNRAMKEACELDAVTNSVWEPIASIGSEIDQQVDLYRKNVKDHIEELGKLGDHARSEYLQYNAEAIFFDTYALLRTLKVYAEYQALRAAMTKKRIINDESEVKLLEMITRELPAEIEESLQEIRQLTNSLVRELRKIAELPGRATLPLTKKRKGAKISKLTCQELLDTIGPLAAILQPEAQIPAAPDAVCAPEDFDLGPYLHALSFSLEDGETLLSVAFPYEVGKSNSAGVTSKILDRRVDASWDALTPGLARPIKEKVASSTFVAVTDRRIITAIPENLLKLGDLSSVYPLDAVQYVRGHTQQESSARRQIDVLTEKGDLHWMFPDDANTEDIENLVSVLSGRASRAGHDPAAIEKSSTPDLAVDS
ncbi:hypothetical protein HCH15_10990 [Corynebacterium testudinoris]|uniref:Uncharacterized protein n=1 Tax=Corynebacterium testudinoris TaxID=136857 RepID=A0A0G3HC44_9CORY|nr:hypothetical protein [Corynebacterium testudinoris]AKK09518.1 hypothetical protein CTEST_10485 [Corynebacterium testudinoris]MBX8996698.1 hypothetical protein [Corynebacterium testudinoris]